MLNLRFCLYCRFGFRKGEDYKQVYSKSDVKYANTSLDVICILYT